MDRRALGDLPWQDYDVEVVITVFVPDREIAWTIEGRLKPPLRHVYGYRLEPAGMGVLVTPMTTGWSSTRAGRARQARFR